MSDGVYNNQIQSNPWYSGAATVAKLVLPPSATAGIKIIQDQLLNQYATPNLDYSNAQVNYDKATGKILGSSDYQSQTPAAPSSSNPLPNLDNNNSQNAGKQGYFKNELGNWVPEGGGVAAPDYSSYFAELDRQIGDLGNQRSGQEQIAQNTYNQGMNTLNQQLTQGKTDLETNQQKTLRDLANNMRQSWQQGNAMLGTRGASDSSAANQYAFALTKFGNQQRGDVQSQYQSQLSKLQSTYDTESKNLELAKNTQLQQIAQWFADAQNQLRGTVGQAKMQQSQQAYQTALQMMQSAQQEAASRRAALDQWALNRATSYGEAAKAMGVYGSTQAATPTMTGLFGNQPQQRTTGVSAGYGQDWTKYPNNGYSY